MLGIKSNLVNFTFPRIQKEEEEKVKKRKEKRKLIKQEKQYQSKVKQEQERITFLSRKAKLFNEDRIMRR